MIRLKRAYDPPAPSDGIRILVERLWPRGIKKSDLALDEWVKDAAPSTELRQWFSHDVAKWPEFQRRYRAELKDHPEALARIRDAERRRPVTLIFSSHDTEHNNAVVLCNILSRSQSENHANTPARIPPRGRGHDGVPPAKAGRLHLQGRPKH